jgi:predicted ArsR family transcriptional regulator
MSNQRQVALASLTDEFTDAIPGIAEKLEISNTAARSLLRAMVSDEKVECRKTNGRIMWRRL